MRRKRLQNYVAESRVALYLTAIYTLLIWMAAGLFEDQLWVQLGCMVAATVMMVELNNQNALIRIYSRMVSCSFMVLMSTATFLMPQLDLQLLTACMAAFYLVIFHTYQDNTSTGTTFYAYLLWGLASMAFVQLLFFVPILWFVTAKLFVAVSKRTFVASLLGLLLPYWIAGGGCIFLGDPQFLVDHFLQLSVFYPVADFSSCSEHLLVTMAFITLLGITGIIHFLRQSSNDKLRIRDFYYFFMVMFLTTIIFMILQPQYSESLLPILIINTAPLIGHFIALTHTRITNIAFCAIILTTLAITAYNLWISSLIF